MSIDTPSLDASGLRRFQNLRSEAISAVTTRFFAIHDSPYASFGERGREACREDLAFHLEFLRPVLEFGLIQPMVDYLRWLASVLATRDVPAEHLPLSLDWLSEFFILHMAESDGATVATALSQIKSRYLGTNDAAPAIDRLMPERWPDGEAFESALLAGDRRGAGSLVDRCLDQGQSLIDVELHIIQPALYAIGHKWQSNQVTVVQEHLATAIAQSVMSEGLLKSRPCAANGRRIVLACVEGNNHAVGLQMVSDAFHLAGWEAQYLGANVPTRALIQHLGMFKTDLLGLSVSFAQQLPVVREIMRLLTQSHGATRPAVIIGGLAINQFSRLTGMLGADASSPDSRSAVAAVSRLAVQPQPA